MEEIELDRLGDARLQRPYGLRGARGQDGDPCIRETLLQAAQRRKGDDAIADMVELDHQDFADFVALQHRPASDQHLVRLAVGREIVLVPRQMRAEKRVAGEKQVAPFAVEDGGIVLVGHAGTADGLVMDESRVRRENRHAPETV